jgi:hypothetical protein
MYKESATERATSGGDAQSKALTIIAPLMVLAACKMKDKGKAKSAR